MRLMNWDDLRVVRAIFQTGSYAAAAQRLRVNETTVSRRLARIEQDLGERLFDAVDGSRKPTARCTQIMVFIERMASQAEGIERHSSPPEGPVGSRRIAATDSIATEILAPSLVPLLEQHPGLNIDLRISPSVVDLARWEADIAIQFKTPDNGDMIVTKLADLRLSYVEPAKPPAGDMPILCAFPEDQSNTPEMRFLCASGLAQRTRVTTRNLVVRKELLKTGRCAGVVFDFAARDLLTRPDLKVTPLTETFPTWLLIQPHLRHDPATRAVVDWIREAFRQATSETLDSGVYTKAASSMSIFGNSLRSAQ